MLEQQPQEICAGQCARPDLAGVLGVSKGHQAVPATDDVLLLHDTSIEVGAEGNDPSAKPGAFRCEPPKAAWLLAAHERPGSHLKVAGATITEAVRTSDLLLLDA